MPFLWLSKAPHASRVLHIIPHLTFFSVWPPLDCGLLEGSVCILFLFCILLPSTVSVPKHTWADDC